MQVTIANGRHRERSEAGAYPRLVILSGTFCAFMDQVYAQTLFTPVVHHSNWSKKKVYLTEEHV